MYQSHPTPHHATTRHRRARPFPSHEGHGLYLHPSTGGRSWRLIPPSTDDGIIAANCNSLYRDHQQPQRRQLNADRRRRHRSTLGVIQRGKVVDGLTQADEGLRFLGGRELWEEAQEELGLPTLGPEVGQESAETLLDGGLAHDGVLGHPVGALPHRPHPEEGAALEEEPMAGRLLEEGQAHADLEAEAIPRPADDLGVEATIAIEEAGEVGGIGGGKGGHRCHRGSHGGLSGCWGSSLGIALPRCSWRWWVGKGSPI